MPGQYTRHCVFTVFGEDRIKQLNIQNGEDLTVQFDIDAREYNGRWYNDFKAYNVIRGQLIPQPQTIEQKTPTINVEDPFGTNNGSDLPF